MVMMKNQILENDAAKSIGRKFGAVKIGLMNVNTPVAVREAKSKDFLDRIHKGRDCRIHFNY